MTQFSHLAILATVGMLSLAACSRETEAPANDLAAGNSAMADNAMTSGNGMSGNVMAGAAQSFAFTGGDGTALGSVSLSEDAGGASMTVNASGMPAGVHGIHLHEKGLCDGPKFESAGKHWNPASKQHGRDNPQGAHLGDLANLTVGADGTATTTIPLAGVMMASGANMLADADGTSLVIHAKADDYKTDPSGDSGDRIACAVVAPPR
ncbi:MAG: superoxide dismutase family protein [Sphingomonas bacterium]|nr:superoxide dismutase family protein [Sphingomonas bacterium]